MPDTELSLFRDGSGLANYTGNRIPVFYYNEINSLKLILANQGGYQYQSLGPVTFSLSIGQPMQPPKRGEWRIGNGTATGTAVSFNATTAQLANSLSSVFGSIQVTTYGNNDTSGYLITAATANTALNLLPQSLSLSPACTFDVFETVAPSTGITAQKLLRIRRMPAISKTQYLNVTCFQGTSISASGPSSVCGPWYVTIPEDAQKYPEMLIPMVSITGPLAQTQEIFTGIVYSNNLRANLVDQASGSGILSKTIESGIAVTTSSAGGLLPVFRRRDSFTTTTLYGGTIAAFADIRVEPWGNTGVKISALPVASGFQVSVTLGSGGAPNYLAFRGRYDLGSVTFSGQALDEEFTEARSDSISLTMEINIEEAGLKTNLIQAPVTIRRNIGG